MPRTLPAAASFWPLHRCRSRVAGKGLTQRKGFLKLPKAGRHVRKLGLEKLMQMIQRRFGNKGRCALRRSDNLSLEGIRLWGRKTFLPGFLFSISSLRWSSPPSQLHGFLHLPVHYGNRNSLLLLDVLILPCCLSTNHYKSCKIPLSASSFLPC